MCLRGRRHLHLAPNCYKKILLLHRRTIAYEPRPNMSPRPLRPRTPSAGRSWLHAPAHLRCACVLVCRFLYRALQTYGLRARTVATHCLPTTIPPHSQPSPATADHNRVAEFPTKPPACSQSLFIIHHLSFIIVLHLLRQRKGLRNGLILLWFKVLQQRFEHLAERGPAGGEISPSIELCLL